MPCLEVILKGQCPDYAHARASSVFSSKDNRTVILTRHFSREICIEVLFLPANFFIFHFLAKFSLASPDRGLRERGDPSNSI